MTARAPREISTRGEATLISGGPLGGLRALPAVALLLALALPACRGARPVEGRPSPRAGWLVYGLRDLRFEAPAGWRATGDDRRVTLEDPDGRARLELTVPEAPFADERACLAEAEERLARSQAELERARRFASRFAGRSAQSLEADRGGWHVWAVAACDGGTQYRIFFTAATPASGEALEAWKTLRASARIGGEA
jgi:hypothetical protein